MVGRAELLLAKPDVTIAIALSGFASGLSADLRHRARHVSRSLLLPELIEAEDFGTFGGGGNKRCSRF